MAIFQEDFFQTIKKIQFNSESKFFSVIARVSGSDNPAPVRTTNISFNVPPEFGSSKTLISTGQAVIAGAQVTPYVITDVDIKSGFFAVATDLTVSFIRAVAFTKLTGQGTFHLTINVSNNFYVPGQVELRTHKLKLHAAVPQQVILDHTSGSQTLPDAVDIRIFPVFGADHTVTYSVIIDLDTLAIT